jgi:hypothetical protein
MSAEEPLARRMNFTSASLGIFSLLGLLLAGCNRTGQPHILESGETVSLLYAGVVEDTFFVEYCTQHAMRDRISMGRQADDVLASLAERAKATGLRDAHVLPTVCHWQVRWAGWYPVIVGEESTAFTYGRTADGRWSRD